MAEQLQKLRPDRDLQCYFDRPSAVAALSNASQTGFTLSGCWRQQSDWAVVEWNRDNVFEHPALRNIPDGDLSGLVLTYEEVRTNCIIIDSNLYPTVAWPYLRVWTDDTGTEPYYVELYRNATVVDGAYSSAQAEFELRGTPSVGDYVELAWLDEHYNYRIGPGDSLSSIVATLAQTISQSSGLVSATADGSRISLRYKSDAGSNGNRNGVYGTEFGTRSQYWSPEVSQFKSGSSPSKWRIRLDFGSLRDINGQPVPTNRVRKLRWTWAADLQAGAFQRSEFSVAVTNWNVTGTNRTYTISGPGSRRVEDDAPELTYSPGWTEYRGNFSGGSIRCTTLPGASVSYTYRATQAHRLYLGTRRAESAGPVAIIVDGQAAKTIDLHLTGEDVLVRVDLGPMSPDCTHTVKVSHAGASGLCFYFDFFEACVPCADLPDFPVLPDTTLATDWDTDHSIAIAPERTAWLVKKLGFTGRANHYVGALWFYELVRAGHVYACASIQFSGSPEFGKTTRVSIGPTVIQHLNLIGDTPDSLASCFALLINAGATALRAEATGSTLKLISRTMGTLGNGLAITVNTNSANFVATPGATTLSGGCDGTWLTDCSATPRVNRAARDWSRSYFKALAGYGIGAAAALSMELQHGDGSVDAGIAQRYPDGSPAWLNTPALQTNFSPSSRDFWKQVYADMAQVMTEAGVVPYLQFGEVQWWYFANSSGMPFYDEYTRASFQARYGRPMQVIPRPDTPPANFLNEVDHLPKLIGEFTDSIMAFVRSSYPSTVFEVLYPPDVNDTPLNRLINYPRDSWTPSALRCLKTENFTYTGDRNLIKAQESIALPAQLGFPAKQSSHLVGIGEYTTPWDKEHRLAQASGLESVVLFALDQFCLIGYNLPLGQGPGRSMFQGSY